MEQQIWEHLQANAPLEFTTIDRVTCKRSLCEIVFTGPDFRNDPKFEEFYTSWLFKLAKDGHPAHWSSIVREETRPGAEVTVIRLGREKPHSTPSGARP
jgi:hypothetical protein